MLYFAYGSNMHPMRAYQRMPGARLAGTGILYSWRLRERLYADIEEDLNSKVYGVLYEVDADDLFILDRYEGAPRVYRRIHVRVETEGEFKEAVAYVMTRATREERDGQNYPEYYRQICSFGAEFNGIKNQFKRRKTKKMKNQNKTFKVAVYGTLMTGESNSAYVPGRITRRRCTMTGTLFDTGSGYPAFIPEGKTTVQAELLEVTSETLVRLDRLEGVPYLYEREDIEVTLEDGTKEKCQVYVMRNLPVRARVIKGGSWQEYRRAK